MSAVRFWCDSVWRSYRFALAGMVMLAIELPGMIATDLRALADPVAAAERDAQIKEQRRRWQRVDEEDAPRGV